MRFPHVGGRVPGHVFPKNEQRRRRTYVPMLFNAKARNKRRRQPVGIPMRARLDHFLSAAYKTQREISFAAPKSLTTLANRLRGVKRNIFAQSIFQMPLLRKQTKFIAPCGKSARRKLARLRSFCVCVTSQQNRRRSVGRHQRVEMRYPDRRWKRASRCKSRSRRQPLFFPGWLSRS